jgi:hypothetical protein
MYALYSFCGGNANVYAPMLYSDRLAVHEHWSGSAWSPRMCTRLTLRTRWCARWPTREPSPEPFAVSTEPLGGGGLPE